MNCFRHANGISHFDSNDVSSHALVSIMETYARLSANRKHRSEGFGGTAVFGRSQDHFCQLIGAGLSRFRGGTRRPFALNRLRLASVKNVSHALGLQCIPTRVDLPRIYSSSPLSSN